MTLQIKEKGTQEASTCMIKVLDSVLYLQNKLKAGQCRFINWIIEF